MSARDNVLQQFHNHIKVAEEWVMKHYDSADEFKSVDLNEEANRVFEAWGLGQNMNMDLDAMVDALSFVQTNREVYFQ